MELSTVFLKHKEWVDSAGESGKQINLDEVDMHGVKLEPPLLEQGYFSACDFKGIKFDGIDFYQSEFYSCDFSDAVFTNCDFRKTTLDYSDFSGAAFIGCKFSRADAYQAKFCNCSFKECSFVGFNLMEADMSQTIFEAVDFDEAYIDKSNMEGATNISPKNLDKANHISIVLQNGEILEGSAAIGREKK